MNSMIPILILIGVGFILDRKFKLDLYTLSKLNFYILLPTFIFRAMYEAKLNSGTLEIVFVAFCVLILNSILSDVVGRIQGYDVAKIATLKNCVMFNNVGNMGVALAIFVFTNVPYVIDGATPYANLGLVSVVSIMIIQTISSNTYGFYQAGAGRLSPRDALKLYSTCQWFMPSQCLYSASCYLLIYTVSSSLRPSISLPMPLLGCYDCLRCTN